MIRQRHRHLDIRAADLDEHSVGECFLCSLLEYLWASFRVYHWAYDSWSVSGLSKVASYITISSSDSSFFLLFGEL